MLILLFMVLITIGIMLSHSDRWYVPGTIIILIFSIFLIFAVCIVLPIQRSETRSEIKQFQSVEKTLEVARKNKNISQLELAAVQQEIVKSNMWLANIQYWNSNIWFDIFIPDEVKNLKPIE